MLRFLFCTLLLGSLTANAQSTEEDYTFSEKHIYPVLRKGTDFHSGITFLSGALASLVARPNDDYVRERWKKHQKISPDDTTAGDFIGTGAGSVLVMGAQYFWDPNEDHLLSHLRGFAYGGIAIYSLKTLFARNRPGNSDNRQSFPSGHVTITAMTATHLSYAYGWPAAALSIPITVYTAATRVADDVHWFSDVVGGMFLGYYVGRATFYDKSAYRRSGEPAVENAKGNQTFYQLIPLISSRSTGLNFFMSY